MKKFCIKALLFGFITCSFFFLLDVAVTKGLRKDNKSNLGVWNAIYAGNIDSEVIINGSSRAVYHIDPTIIADTLRKTSYNLGMDGQMFELQYCRFKVYLEHNPPPKVIIHSVDCHTLCKTEGIYDYHQFLPFLGDTIVKNALINLQGLSKNDFVLPMARYAGEFKLISYGLKRLVSGKKASESDRVNGFEGQDRPWNNDLEVAKKLYPKKLSYTLDDRVIKLFEEYIEYCKEHNIKLILVYTPEYIEGQKLIKNRKNIIRFYETLAERYHVPFLNYSESRISDDKSLFYNSLHLNVKGAKIFTSALSQDIKSLKKDLNDNTGYSFSCNKKDINLF